MFYCMKVFDFFFGFGGLLLGMRCVGIEFVVCVEKSKDVVVMYDVYMFDVEYYCFDICSILFECYCGEVDVVFGGLLC